ncbi:hypothetical protein BP6252_02519 [Coleophoma cylindrospora]|uniref:Thymocyte nuclear protein 1 n=1 Tax=Coleophoma cylindrospora TaxID=1849047 RepID=A0A3D8SF20_9HELO|nr:hypothetical protein BP6252_02519 [Coleophoma cylindrospora]
MAKRKAKEIDASIPTEEPRRSSRRKSTKEEVIEEKSLAAKPAKKPKKEAGAEAETTIGVNNSKKIEGEVRISFVFRSSLIQGDIVFGGLSLNHSHLIHPQHTHTPVEETALQAEASFTELIIFQSLENVDKPSDSKSVAQSQESKSTSTGRQYWLMKAEPESRIERGHDIKFSIDDLAAKKEPEPWDGIRAYAARNNLRAMKKGDLAFFYHSSCKVPAIVGTMEIVQEHSPDLSAHNPKAPYYDPKSKPEDPKWSVVHVEFRQKLKTPVTLKELKEWQTTKGHVLENMQMLKLARLSVSKVSEEEWRFLTGVMKENGDVIED